MRKSAQSDPRRRCLLKYPTAAGTTDFLSYSVEHQGITSRSQNEHQGITSWSQNEDQGITSRSQKDP